MIKIYKNFKDDRMELCIPDWFGYRNPNNTLIHFFFTYGNSNGYTNEFCLDIVCPWNWGFYKNTHNGHARIFFGCGLFAFHFDYLSKKSIIHENI